MAEVLAGQRDPLQLSLTIEECVLHVTDVCIHGHLLDRLLLGDHLGRLLLWGLEALTILFAIALDIPPRHVVVRIHRTINRPLVAGVAVPDVLPPQAVVVGRAGDNLHLKRCRLYEGQSKGCN